MLPIEECIFLIMDFIDILKFHLDFEDESDFKNEEKNDEDHTV